MQTQQNSAICCVYNPTKFTFCKVGMIHKTCAKLYRLTHMHLLFISQIRVRYPSIDVTSTPPYGFGPGLDMKPVFIPDRSPISVPPPATCDPRGSDRICPPFWRICPPDTHGEVKRSPARPCFRSDIYCSVMYPCGYMIYFQNVSIQVRMRRPAAA